MLKNKIIYTGLFCVLSIVSLAQNAKEDFKKINEAYKNNIVSMDMLYSVYKNTTTDIALQTETGKMIRKGEQIYIKIGNFEWMKNPSYSLAVDHNMKLISLLASEKAIGGQPGTVNFDYISDILGVCKKVEFVQGTKSSQYILTPPEGVEFSQIKISFNNKKYFVERMELFYSDAYNLQEDYKEDAAKEKPRLVITYSNINLNPVVNNNIFIGTAYLVKVKQKYHILGKYKDYQFINQLEK